MNLAIIAEALCDAVSDHQRQLYPFTAGERGILEWRMIDHRATCVVLITWENDLQALPREAPLQELRVVGLVPI